MIAYEVASFTRIANSQLGPGQTTSYTNALGEQLAYIDYNHDRTEAGVVVFTPYNGGQRRYSQRPVERAEAILEKHLAKEGYCAPVEAEVDVAVGIDGDVVVYAQRTSDGETIVVTELTNYKEATEEQLQAAIDAVLEERHVDMEGAGCIVGHPDDIEETETKVCPRCGINELNPIEVWNSLSRYAPVYICSPCGTHEALSNAGLDLWHDQQALAAALRARAEKAARETLCEVTPAQKSAMRSAVVWPL